MCNKMTVSLTGIQSKCITLVANYIPTHTKLQVFECSYSKNISFFSFFYNTNWL